ncbi:MAG TPA: lysophospholipid acyltransferase family protein [Magnetospirillaceae bacterium]|nr:lysophospholipid acyltransferase family protein [Magnetospirillaceae bacterium]
MIRTKNAFILPSGFAISLCQMIVASLYRCFLRCSGGFSTDVHLPAGTAHRKRYIIAANHQSMLDPFAIFALIPFRHRLPVLPIKFMTIPKVYHRWYVKPFAYLLGCYPAHVRERNHHTYGIDGTIKLLGYGYNICIFPEGTRTLQKESDPKHGIVKVMEQYPDATLILAHLQWTRGRKGGRHIAIKIAPAPASLDKTSPKAIMDAIYGL